MKKFVLTVLILLFIHAANAAANFMPYYTGSLNHFGIGAVRIPNQITIYETPDTNSKIIQKIFWSTAGDFYTLNSKRPSEIFLAFMPGADMVFLSVDDEDENWIKVCYDQKLKLFGWIKKEETEKIKFYPYREMLYKFGKKYGIYTFKNLPPEYKTLHSAPNQDSSIVDEFNMAKFITPWLIQGNWMLVKVTTYDNKTKTGWFRWRSDEGVLYAFVNLRP